MRTRRYPRVAVFDRAVALFVECGDLVVAIEAEFTVRILLATDTMVRSPEREGHPLQVDSGAGLVPGWDLPELLGWTTAVGTSWIIARAPRSWPFRAFALRTGRCICVRPMPSVTTLPAGLFEQRGRGFTAGFKTSTIPELTAFPSGIVLDPTKLLSSEQIERGAASTMPEAAAGL